LQAIGIVSKTLSLRKKKGGGEREEDGSAHFEVGGEEKRGVRKKDGCSR